MQPYVIETLFVSYSETTRLSKIRSLIRQMPLKPHIVTEDWITDSIEKHCQLEERNYEPQ